MAYEKLDEVRKEIEAWVSLIGKKRVEERLRISILDLPEKMSPSVAYE